MGTMCAIDYPDCSQFIDAKIPVWLRIIRRSLACCLILWRAIVGKSVSPLHCGAVTAETDHTGRAPQCRLGQSPVPTGRIAQPASYCFHTRKIWPDTNMEHCFRATRRRLSEKPPRQPHSHIVPTEGYRGIYEPTHLWD